MSNGTIPEKDKSVLKELVALLMVLIGGIGFIVGIGREFGLNGVLITCCPVLLAIGIRLGLSQTGKE